MHQKKYFFIYIFTYMQIIFYIQIKNKIFIEKLNNKNLTLKIIKIIKLNKYFLDEIEIIKNKNYKLMFS